MRKTAGIVILAVFCLAVAVGCKSGGGGDDDPPAIPKTGSGPKVISPFGALVDGEGRPRPEGPHSGVDVSSPIGTPVLAGADGTVWEAREVQSIRPGVVASCGKRVVIQHDAARTAHCHLSDIAVAEGQSVKRGQRIGAVGTTGWLGPPPPGKPELIHVHWELLVGGFTLVDPLARTVGCFDPKASYTTGSLVLTYPVPC